MPLGQQGEDPLDPLHHFPVVGGLPAAQPLVGVVALASPQGALRGFMAPIA